MTSYRFMGQGEPETFRGRVYDGTEPRPDLVQWRDLQGVAHLWPKGQPQALCGATTAIGVPVELEPGADFGVAVHDCPRCAEGATK